jgi:hypothetical protein
MLTFNSIIFPANFQYQAALLCVDTGKHRVIQSQIRTMPTKHFYLTIYLPLGDQQNMHKIGLRIKTYNLHVINNMFIDSSCCHHILSAVLVRHAGVGWVCVGTKLQ